MAMLATRSAVDIPARIRAAAPSALVLLALTVGGPGQAADSPTTENRVGPGGSVAPACGSQPPPPGASCNDANPAATTRPAPDIRFPDYQAVADRIAGTPDPVKRKKAEEYLAQARSAWDQGFHETALDLLRTAVVATY